MPITRRKLARTVSATVLGAGLAPGATRAQKRYGPGASDAEIRVGQTMAYSGPASAYGVQGLCHAAFFRMVNEAGGVNVFFDIATSKFAAQAIRKLADIDWRPVHFLNSTASSIAATLIPAGLQKSVGLITSIYLKDINDPAFADAPDVKFYLDFMKKYLPDGAPNDGGYAYALATASTLMQVVRQCGDDLSRENVMRQAANLRELEVPMLLPGIRVNTSPTRFYPVNQEQMARFDGKSWVRFGQVMSAA